MVWASPQTKKTRLCDLGGVLPPCQKVGAQNVGKILQLARGKCILHLHICGCAERRVENPGAWGEMFCPRLSSFLIRTMKPTDFKRALSLLALGRMLLSFFGLSPLGTGHIFPRKESR